MQGTTRRWDNQPGLALLHGLAVLSLFGLALLGQVPGEVGGLGDAAQAWQGWRVLAGCD